MSSTDGQAAKVPAGWYPHPTSGVTMWWNGEKWLETDEVAAVEQRRGSLLLQISRKSPNPTLSVYENEIWKVAAPGFGVTLGGSMADAHAVMASQNQFNSTAALGGRKLHLAAGTTLHVSAPSFEFYFELLPKEMNEQYRKQLLWTVEYVNNKSRELGVPDTAAEPAPASPGVLSVADEIAKFAALRDQGILTDEEFAAKKAQLLA